MSNEPNTQPESQAEAPAPDVAALQAELEKARDQMLRALADAENTRRRAEKQAVEARVYAIDRFATDLLPVADTLTRALQAVPPEVREHPDDALRNLIAGLELTERSLIEAFARHGLKRVGARGDTFDPNLHQAVAQAPSDVAAGKIAEVMQPGYVLGDRTIRAAMVLVSGGPAGGQSEQAHIDVKV